MSSNPNYIRPAVHVNPQTANTTSVRIVTNNGDAWCVISHEKIIITSNNLEVEVRP